MHIASYSGDLWLVGLLLDHDAGVDVVDLLGNCALLIASTLGHLDVVKLLLKHGAEINKVNNYYETALYKASARGHTEVVQVLLGRDPEIYKGEAALLKASAEGHLKVVEVLLDHAVEIDRANPDGETALLIASAKGRPEVVKLLLKRGAEIDKVNNYNETALCRASARGHTEVVVSLVNGGAVSSVRIDVLLLRAGWERRDELVSVFTDVIKIQDIKQYCDRGNKPAAFDAWKSIRESSQASGLLLNLDPSQINIIADGYVAYNHSYIGAQNHEAVGLIKGMLTSGDEVDFKILQAIRKKANKLSSMVHLAKLAKQSITTEIKQILSKTKSQDAPEHGAGAGSGAGAGGGSLDVASDSVGFDPELKTAILDILSGSLENKEAREGMFTQILARDNLQPHNKNILKYLFTGVSNTAGDQTDSRFVITATLIDGLRASSDDELSALSNKKDPSRFFSMFQMLGSAGAGAGAGADAGQSEEAADKEEVQRENFKNSK